MDFTIRFDEKLRKPPKRIPRSVSASSDRIPRSVSASSDRIPQSVSIKIKKNNETECVFRLPNLSLLFLLSISVTVPTPLWLPSTHTYPTRLPIVIHSEALYWPLSLSLHPMAHQSCTHPTLPLGCVPLSIHIQSLTLFSPPLQPD